MWKLWRNLWQLGNPTRHVFRNPEITLSPERIMKSDSRKGNKCLDGWSRTRTCCAVRFSSVDGLGSAADWVMLNEDDVCSNNQRRCHPEWQAGVSQWDVRLSFLLSEPRLMRGNASSAAFDLIYAASSLTDGEINTSAFILSVSECFYLPCSTSVFVPFHLLIIMCRFYHMSPLNTCPSIDKIWWCKLKDVPRHFFFFQKIDIKVWDSSLIEEPMMSQTPAVLMTDFWGGRQRWGTHEVEENPSTGHRWRWTRTQGNNTDLMKTYKTVTKGTAAQRQWSKNTRTKQVRTRTKEQENTPQ